MIHSYSYKPTPIFFKSDEERKNGREQYYGVELELVFPSFDKIVSFDERLQFEGLADRIYLKKDGSLGCYGVEIVSYPMTLIEHNNYNWERVLEIASGFGAVGHDDERCGMHVRISRSYFKCDTDIKKVMSFVDTVFENMYTYTRRRSRAKTMHYAPPFGLDNYSTFEGKKRRLNAEFKRNNKKEESGQRYRAVNIVNLKTVEFRSFQSTTKFESFMACIELVDKISRWSLNQSYEDLFSYDIFEKFIVHMFNQHTSYIYLTRYFADRMVRKNMIDHINMVRDSKFAVNTNCFNG